MIVTINNVNEPATVEWFISFVKIITLLMEYNINFHGQFASFYMAACEYYGLIWNKYESLCIIIKKIKYIDFTKIIIVSLDEDMDWNEFFNQLTDNNQSDIYDIIFIYKQDRISYNYYIYQKNMCILDTYKFKLDIIHREIYENIYTIYAINDLLISDHLVYNSKYGIQIVKETMPTLMTWATLEVPALKKYINNYEAYYHISIINHTKTYIMNLLFDIGINHIIPIHKYSPHRLYEDAIKHIHNHSNMSIYISNVSDTSISIYNKNNDDIKELTGDITNDIYTNNDKLRCYNTYNCTICHDDFEQSEILITTECYHKYHYNCMYKWVNTIGNKYINEYAYGNCPLCKSKTILYTYEYN